MIVGNYLQKVIKSSSESWWIESSTAEFKLQLHDLSSG